MNAPMIRGLVWKLMQDLGAVTKDELIAKVLADGAKPKEVEGQIVGVLRLLEIEKLITEDIDSKGDRFWKLSKEGEKKIRQEEKKARAPEQGDMYEVETVIRLTGISLAGSIPAANTDAGRLEWPRQDGKVVLFPNWFKGMFRKVFERLQIVPHYVADRLMFDPILLDVTTDWIKIPIPPDPKSHSGGKGINIYEVLPVGTEITVRGVFPGWVIPRDKVSTLWRYAGRIGFSVGKSKLGFGTFEVVRCTVLDSTLDFSSAGEAAN